MKAESRGDAMEENRQFQDVDANDHDANDDDNNNDKD